MSYTPKILESGTDTSSFEGFYERVFNKILAYMRCVIYWSSCPITAVNCSTKGEAHSTRKHLCSGQEGPSNPETNIIISVIITTKYCRLLLSSFANVNSDIWPKNSRIRNLQHVCNVHLTRVNSSSSLKKLTLISLWILCASLQNTWLHWH